MNYEHLDFLAQHRYYGRSIPSRPNLQDVYNATSLGYLNSAQALADYAEIILHLKRNLSAEASPVIVIGGSYGGSTIYVMNHKEHVHYSKLILLLSA